MALQVTGLKRVFKFQKGGKDVVLDDPNPTMNPTEVQKFYSGQYPEITNATLSGPKVVGNNAEYSLKTTVGTKG